MKQSKTVTQAIKLIYEMSDKIDRLDRIVKDKYSGKLLVTFYHDAARNLLYIKWSDQYYGDKFREKQPEIVYEYAYSITSSGIHFESYAQCKWDIHWSKRIYYWSTGDSNMRLTAVPNFGPPNQNTHMYLFHQEKIREHLSGLPAWAIAVMSD
jgi:hypothetical protein